MPASGVAAPNNPYAGTPLADVWQQGFDAGFAQPDEDHPAPSPFTPDAQTVYSEGVLAGSETGKPPQGGASVGPPPGESGGTSDSDSSESRWTQALKLAAEKVGGAAGDKLLELASPANVAMLMGFVGLYVAAQWTPAGWVADGIAIVTLIAGAAMMGKELSTIIDDVRAFASITSNPNGDLDAAADHLAKAVAAIGIDTLMLLLLHKAGSAAKPYIKPPSGFVDMVTTDGTIVPVPADVAADPNASMSEGSGESGSGAKPAEPVGLPKRGDVLQVDPEKLHLPENRQTGPDPMKMLRVSQQYPDPSTAPPIDVSVGAKRRNENPEWCHACDTANVARTSGYGSRH